MLKKFHIKDGKALVKKLTWRNQNDGNDDAADDADDNE